MNTTKKNRSAFAAGLLAVVLVAAWARLGRASLAVPTTLRVAGTTTVEIVLAWDPLPGATAYALERSASPAFAPSYVFNLPTSVTGYGDTGVPLQTADRFNINKLGPPSNFLQGTTYYYRLRATFSDASQSVSATVSAQPAAGPTRGVTGDFYADVVLGQPDWFNYLPGRAKSTDLNLASGLGFDRTVTPNRVFFMDANNNRVLGLSHLGRCSDGSPCTEGCAAGACALTPGQVVPEVLIGQPNFSSSAGNGDSTFHDFPTRASPSASNLSIVKTGGISPREAVAFANPVVDAGHNVYVPDAFNCRILMYKDPFNPANDAVADEVWGQQGDFATGAANKGGLSATSLSLWTGWAGLEIDPQGNLWVADSVNHRVLRFPFDAAKGWPSRTADFVLGQAAFNTANFRAGDELDRLYRPMAVRVDAAGNVYVLEWGSEDQTRASRLVRYGGAAIAAARAAGQITAPAEAKLLPGPGDPAGMLWQPGALAIDAGRGGIWVETTTNGRAMLFDFATQRITRQIGNGVAGRLRGMDLDSAGNVYLMDVHNRECVRKYSAALIDQSSPASPVPFTSHETALYADGEFGLDSFLGVTGMTLYGSQLVTTDLYRMAFWNDYAALASGPSVGRAADGAWDPSSSNWATRKQLAAPRVDGGGRLWVSTLNKLTAQTYQPTLHAFSGPLTAASQPVKSVAINQLVTKEGEAFSPYYQDTVQFLPIGSGDRAWVAPKGLVARVVNLDGATDPNRGPFVDIVLGKPSVTSPNSPTWSASTLTYPRDVRLDPDGNLWIVDQDETVDGQGSRLLKFNAADIPDNPPATVYAIPAADVYGTGGRFDVRTSCYGNSETDYETGCHTGMPAFDGAGRFVVGVNPYGNSQHTLVYLNYLLDKHPQMALGDVRSAVIDSFFDPQGNLYLGDWNWNRVLIYKNPLQNFDPPSYLRFTASSFSVNEAGGAATITVERTGARSGTATVNYATSNGTATAGLDYTSSAGTLTFAPGEASKSFTVPILNDTNLGETTETVNLTLSNAAGNRTVLASPSTAVLSIAPSSADLWMSAVSSSVSGRTVAFTDTAQNIGTAGIAEDFRVRYYLSTDSTITTSDVYLGQRTVLSLGAGAASSGSASFTAPASLPAGSYYAGAFADGTTTIAESNEGNNGRASISASVPFRPDLVFSNFSPSAASGLISITNEFTNQGTAATSGSFYGYFYLSADAVADGFDPFLGNRARTANLNAGAGNQDSTDFPVPAGTAPGDYYVWGNVDATNTQVEANEGNNKTVSVSRVAVRPDLLVASLSATQSGTNVTVVSTVRNDGVLPTAGSFRVDFYLSADTTINSSDVLIGNRTVTAALAVGGTSTTTTVLPIPQTLAPGMWRVGAVADGGAAIAEASETNNTENTPRLALYPDLVAVSITASASGRTVTVSDTIRNDGALPAAAPFGVDLYLSADSLISGADALLASRTVSSNLAPGASHSAATVATAPGTVAAGNYYAGSWADGGTVLPEITESNNKKATVGTVPIGP